MLGEVPEPETGAQDGGRGKEVEEPPFPGQAGRDDAPDDGRGGDDPQPGPPPVEQQQGGGDAGDDQRQAHAGDVRVEDPQLAGQVAQAQGGRRVAAGDARRHPRQAEVERDERQRGQGHPAEGADRRSCRLGPPQPQEVEAHGRHARQDCGHRHQVRTSPGPGPAAVRRGALAAARRRAARRPGPTRTGWPAPPRAVGGIRPTPPARPRPRRPAPGWPAPAPASAGPPCAGRRRWRSRARAT